MIEVSNHRQKSDRIISLNLLCDLIDVNVDAFTLVIACSRIICVIIMHILWYKITLSKCFRNQKNTRKTDAVTKSRETYDYICTFMRYVCMYS